jgi:large subunit ribosomal protein L19|tara:strand:- start:1265 stop:1807 length:543 start_codon:yes stop_codon:yes gene_type:complete
MQTPTTAISSVNMEERAKLGIRPGDTVRVWQKIEEKGKTRTQAFEGLVLARKHGNEPGATFTVRRVASGIGVEKIFPLYSPMIDKIEIIKRSKVRRAKLYYIREKVAREIRRQMRNMRLVDIATRSEAERAAEKAKAEEDKAKTEEKSASAEASADKEDDVKAAEEAPKKEEAPQEDKKE